MAPRTAAYRWYRRRSVVGAAAYLVSSGLATWLVPDHAPPSAGPVALAVLAGAGTLVWIWATARYLVEIDDEYQRLLQVRGMLVATGLTLSICSVWGMIELYTTAPHLPLFLVFPIWCLGLFAGTLVNKLTLGDSGRRC